MKSLKGWAAALAVTVLVAGAAALSAQSTGWLSLLIASRNDTIQARGLDRYGNPVLVGRGSAVPTVANSGAAPQDGELFIVTASSTDPDVQLYNANDSAWQTIANLDNTSAQTFAGPLTIGTDEDDTITLNGPVVYKVKREDFDLTHARVVEEDYTAAVATDTGENYIILPGSPIGGIHYRVEQAFGGTLTPATFINTGTIADAENRVFKIDDATILDVADNDAVEFTIGGDPTVAVFFDEDSGFDAYCEMSVRIDDISDISANDFYFGWFLAAAYDDAFNYEGADTWAAFGVLDTAGDLVIQAELNGGGHGEDDSGTTLADDGTYVLRVEMSADSVAFYVDGTAVTQTNATLDADDGDQFVCRFGTRSAGTSNPVFEVEYLEVGIEQ